MTSMMTHLHHVCETFHERRWRHHRCTPSRPRMITSRRNPLFVPPLLLFGATRGTTPPREHNAHEHFLSTAHGTHTRNLFIQTHGNRFHINTRGYTNAGTRAPNARDTRRLRLCVNTTRTNIREHGTKRTYAKSLPHHHHHMTIVSHKHKRTHSCRLTRIRTHATRDAYDSA